MGRSRKYKGGAKTISRERKEKIIATVRRLKHIASNCDQAVANAAGEIDSDELYRLIEDELGPELLKLQDNETLKKGRLFGYTRVKNTAAPAAVNGSPVAAAPAPKSFFGRLFGSSTPAAPSAAGTGANGVGAAGEGAAGEGAAGEGAAGTGAAGTGAAGEGAAGTGAAGEGAAGEGAGPALRNTNVGGRRSLHKSKKSRSQRRRTRRTFR